MTYYVTIGDREVRVDLNGAEIRVDGTPVTGDLETLSGTVLHTLLLEGSSYRFTAPPGTEGWWDLGYRGESVRVEVVDERTRFIREMAGGQARQSGPRPLRAPMPGLVVKIEVEAGQPVAEGQGILIVEAMKMENELKAERAGRVEAVLVEPGQPVEKNQVLVEFGELEGA